MFSPQQIADKRGLKIEEVENRIQRGCEELKKLPEVGDLFASMTE
jgi:DNA-directed RNA polymerase specialized sigma24 family protein